MNNGKDTKFTQNKRNPPQHKHLTNKHHDMKTEKREKNKIRKIQSYQNHGYGYEDNYQSYYGPNDLKPVHGHSGYSDSSSLDKVELESLVSFCFLLFLIYVEFIDFIFLDLTSKRTVFILIPFGCSLS